MPYGTIKVDNVTFTNAGVDQNVTVSGLYASTTSNLSVTGTVSGSVLIGSTTVSGATVSGQNASFVSGVFTTGLFSGRVGIGTVTPGYRLTVVNSTGAFDTNLFLTETADPTSKRTALSFNNAWLLNSDTNGVGVEDFGIYSVANNRTLLNFTSGGGTLIDTASGQVPLILYSVGSEIARFTSSSRLGLGTASPNGLLHLQGNSIAESWYTATGASGGSWRVGVGDSLAGLNGGYRIYDATNSATRFFITSGGFVGVKTATPNASFHANHTTLVEPSLIYNSTAGQVFQNELNELAFGVATGVPYATWMQTRSAFSAATPLAINPSGGFIGIGTKSPGSILHCNSSGATDTYVRATNSTGTAGFDFGVSSGAEAYLFNRNNTNLYFGTNSLVRATITSGGNFGINTTPTFTLEVATNSGVQFRSTVPNTNNANIYIGGAGNNQNKCAVIFKPINNFCRGDLLICQNTVQDLNSATEADAKVVINHTGYVGINTTAPTSPLDVRGYSKFGAYSGVYQGISIVNNDNSALSETVSFVDATNDLGTIDSHIFFTHQTTGASSIAIATTATGSRSSDRRAERVRIDGLGRVGIGTASPQSPIDLTSGIAGELTIFVNNTNASGYSAVRLGNSDRGTNGDHLLYGGDRLGIRSKATTPIVIEPTGVECARFNTAGQLLLGTISSRSNQFNSTLTSRFQIEGVDHNTSCASIIRSEVSAGVQYGPNLMLGSTGGGGLNSNTLSSGNGYYGNVSFQGTNGTRFVETVVLRGEIDGTCTSGSMPGRFTIYTTPSGSLAPSERARVNSFGYFKASNDGTYHDSGSTGLFHEFRNSTTTNAVFVVTANNGSYTGNMIHGSSTRAASTAFSLLRLESSTFTDTEFNLRGDGNAFADGTWTGGGADYAEYFEWVDSNPNEEDRRGISVVLDSNKIREAVAGEDPIGVISGNPSVVGDAAWNKWSGKYLRDEFGTYVQEDYEVEDDDGNVVIQQRRKLNPAYDSSVEYIPREQRPEWDCVGLMGKLRIRKGQVTGSRWIKMRDINDSVEEWLVR